MRKINQDQKFTLPLHSFSMIDITTVSLTGIENSKCTIIGTSDNFIACWRIIHVQSKTKIIDVYLEKRHEYPQSKMNQIAFKDTNRTYIDI